jgi:phosphatidylglycerophosphate synthase
MIDAALQPLLRRVLLSPARWLVDRGITADQVTVVGFALGILVIPALSLKAFNLALALLVLNRVADGLDGVVARLTTPSDRGAFLDSVLDSMFYALFVLGFALASPLENGLPAAILITAFIGTGSSFLAFAAIAAKRGLTAVNYSAKGIYYLGGLTEGTETISVFVAMCLFPNTFPTLAYGYAAACTLTTILRWRQGWLTFSEPKKDINL